MYGRDSTCPLEHPILLVKTRNLAFPCSQLMVDVSFNKLFEYRNEFGATAGSKADPKQPFYISQPLASTLGS